MRFAIVDRNQVTRKLLSEWLRAQVVLSPQDQDSNWIFEFATAQEVLELVPTLDVLWLGATPSVRQDIDEIRARSGVVGVSPRPVVVLIIDKDDLASRALAADRQLILLESVAVRSFLASYRIVELLLDGPAQPEQVFRHT